MLRSRLVLIALAIVGLLLVAEGLRRRRAWCLARATAHADALTFLDPPRHDRSDSAVEARRRARAAHHRAMRRKYERAALRPWLPIPADPPPPD